MHSVTHQDCEAHQDCETMTTIFPSFIGKTMHISRNLLRPSLAKQRGIEDDKGEKEGRKERKKNVSFTTPGHLKRYHISVSHIYMYHHRRGSLIVPFKWEKNVLSLWSVGPSVGCCPCPECPCNLHCVQASVEFARNVNSIPNIKLVLAWFSVSTSPILSLKMQLCLL